MSDFSLVGPPGLCSCTCRCIGSDAVLTRMLLQITSHFKAAAKLGA
jgi:hypothetical protein